MVLTVAAFSDASSQGWQHIVILSGAHCLANLPIATQAVPNFVLLYAHVRWWNLKYGRVGKLKPPDSTYILIKFRIPVIYYMTWLVYIWVPSSKKNHCMWQPGKSVSATVTPRLAGKYTVLYCNGHVRALRTNTLHHFETLYVPQILTFLKKTSGIVWSK